MDHLKAKDIRSPQGIWAFWKGFTVEGNWGQDFKGWRELKRTLSQGKARQVQGGFGEWHADDLSAEGAPADPQPTFSWGAMAHAGVGVWLLVVRLQIWVAHKGS